MAVFDATCMYTLPLPFLSHSCSFQSFHLFCPCLPWLLPPCYPYSACASLPPSLLLWLLPPISPPSLPPPSPLLLLLLHTFSPSHPLSTSLLLWLPPISSPPHAPFFIHFFSPPLSLSFFFSGFLLHVNSPPTQFLSLSLSLSLAAHKSALLLLLCLSLSLSCELLLCCSLLFSKQQKLGEESLKIVSWLSVSN